MPTQSINFLLTLCIVVILILAVISALLLGDQHSRKDIFLRKLVAVLGRIVLVPAALFALLFIGHVVTDLGPKTLHHIRIVGNYLGGLF